MFLSAKMVCVCFFKYKHKDEKTVIVFAAPITRPVYRRVRVPVWQCTLGIKVPVL